MSCFSSDLMSVSDSSCGKDTFTMSGYSNHGNAIADKTDLFGWSGSTARAKWGVSTSQDNADYSGDFVDWGTNIGDGKTWYTLTYAEWSYLLSERTNAANLKGIACIHLNADGTEYANGLVLLPDNWTCPAGITFKSGFANENMMQAYDDYQTFTLADWQQLEAAGAVFLPASGYRGGSYVSRVQNYGYYWSATTDDSRYAYYQNFYSSEASTDYGNRYNGLSVRLVRDL